MNDRPLNILPHLRGHDSVNRPHTFLYYSLLCLGLAIILGGVGGLATDRNIKRLEARLTATEACLAHLHIAMERLETSGPEHGAVVATVNCQGE